MSTPPAVPVRRDDSQIRGEAADRAQDASQDRKLFKGPNQANVLLLFPSSPQTPKYPRYQRAKCSTPASMEVDGLKPTQASKALVSAAVASTSPGCIG